MSWSTRRGRREVAVKWSERLLWLGIGMAIGTALTVWNAVRLGYVPWHNTY